MTIMPMPDPLNAFVDSAWGSIEGADSVNITAAAGNAEVMLRSAKSYVVPTAKLNAVFDDAIGRIAEFHEEVVDQNTLIPRMTAAIENARQMALVSLEQLREALSDARPNDEARAIGLDWF